MTGLQMCRCVLVGAVLVLVVLPSRLHAAEEPFSAGDCMVTGRGTGSDYSLPPGSYGRQDTWENRRQRCLGADSAYRGRKQIEEILEKQRRRKEAEAARKEAEAAKSRGQQLEREGRSRKQEQETTRATRQAEKQRALEQQRAREEVDDQRRSAESDRRERCARTGDCGTSESAILEQIKRSREQAKPR